MTEVQRLRLTPSDILVVYCPAEALPSVVERTHIALTKILRTLDLPNSVIALREGENRFEVISPESESPQ